MALYVRLVRFTAKGAERIQSVDTVFTELRGILEANGGKVLNIYSTLGRYDLVAVVEAPDDATMMKASALIAAKGYITAETLPAVPLAEFADAVKRG